MTSGLQMSRRIRRTPYTTRVEQNNVRGFTVVNHMLLPKAFEPSVEDDYWHLKKHAQIWDVSTQRQVELKGPDAAKLVQMMTPRNLSKARVGQCLYVPLVDETGGMINDPVLLKLGNDHFWLSIADSDVLLWAKGLATGAKFDVKIIEPDVSPLAIQGPKAEDLIAKLFGEEVRAIKFFNFGWIDFEGTKQLIARSGFSKQGGFEIYLNGSNLGGRLWDAVWDAGQEFNIRAGCPNLIERIEGGLLSYGNEFTRENNPLECGLVQYCSLDAPVDCLAKDALLKIHKRGIDRVMRGIMFDGPACPPCGEPWPVFANHTQIGQITSAIWSPNLNQNIGLSMIEKAFWTEGQKLQICMPESQIKNGTVALLPFV
ncbi:MAG: dimethylsulfoniopropionate demethylase [Rhodobacterales bacterium]|jgi:dimethylsulfoniopropionate demethylase|tara:strand:- start:144 stop:1256 length:1113 start_codon:yes stop_codon:yes gene_type:complete